MSRTDYKKRISSMIANHDLSVNEIALKLGVTRQTIYNWIDLDKKTIPESDTAVFLAKMLGVSVEHLVTGKETMKNNILPFEAAKKENEYQIPKLNASASMGYGIDRSLDHDSVVSNVSVSKQWISENLSTISKPENLKMITGYGDSMQGTFNHGDVLFVDTGINTVSMDAVYVLSLNDELYIKRLQRLPSGDVRMLSDNEKYEPYLITESEKAHFEVLGRIAGTWNFKRV